MYSILPFALIIISLAIIIIIVVRRYPQLTLLDVDSIPEVKIEKKKVELLKKHASQIHKTKIDSTPETLMIERNY